VVAVGLFKRRSKELFTVSDSPAPVAGSGFRMVVDDVFFINRRGAVATGMVQSGSVGVGSRVTIERAGRPPLAAEIAGIEMFRRKAKRSDAGDNVGLLFRELTRDDILGGDVIRT
jgi:translation elongation factor EF-Tu-like GTPase